MSAQRRWRGPRRRCSSITLASTPAKPDFFNASQATSSSLAAICAPRRMSFGKAQVRNRVCGLKASPAICRSCCCESPRSETLHVARQVLQAHEYWRMKQLAVDLVILNERKSSYVQDLQVAIETLVRASQSRPAPGIDHRPGRVFVLRADLIAAETRSLLVSTARVVLVAQHGSLSDQLDRIADPIEPIRPLQGKPQPLALGDPPRSVRRSSNSSTGWEDLRREARNM